MQNQKSAIGMDANITALIGYPIGILALVLIFIEKDNKFVRFHALQSVLWSVGFTVAVFVIMIVGVILSVILSYISGALGALMWFLMAIIYLVWFVGLIGGLIFGAFKAYNGEMFKLPLVGSMAEKWA